MFFSQTAPKNKKGWIYGVGSIQVIPTVSSSAPTPTEESAELRQSLEAEKKRNAELVSQIEGYDHLFGIIAHDFPALAAALRAQKQPTETAPNHTDEELARNNTSDTHNETDFEDARTEAATAHLSPHA
ncbi:unnamed protein product [Arabidopsis halleri]